MAFMVTLGFFEQCLSTGFEKFNVHLKLNIKTFQDKAVQQPPRRPCLVLSPSGVKISRKPESDVTC
jgi:hypothetical protein